MFNWERNIWSGHRRLGEVDDDIYYFRDVLESDLAYSNTMLSQPIDDYEKERWQAESSQFSGLLADIEIPNINYSQVFGQVADETVLTAGFASEAWPILAIIGIGLIVASRKGNSQVQRKRKRSRRR